MPTFDRVGGAWHKAKKQYDKINGVWKEIKNGYSKVDGVWQKDYTSAVPYVCSNYSDGSASYRFLEPILVSPVDSYSSSAFDINGFSDYGFVGVSLEGFRLDGSGYSHTDTFYFGKSDGWGRRNGGIRNGQFETFYLTSIRGFAGFENNKCHMLFEISMTIHGNPTGILIQQAGATGEINI